MYLRAVRLDQPISRTRWLLILGLTSAAIVVALLQLTPLALFAAERTSTLAGLATGMSFLVAVRYWYGRRAT